MARVGRIVGAHGLKGEVKVEVLTDFIERLNVGRRLKLEGDWITVDAARFQNHRLILKLSGIDDVDSAKAHLWKYLESTDSAAPELDDDEYVTADLIGMSVSTRDGAELGCVADVLAKPAHDILVVGDHLIPAVKQFVKNIDRNARRIEVELIEGM